VLMLWLFIAGLAILFGSEINVLIERRTGGGRHARLVIGRHNRNAETR